MTNPIWLEILGVVLRWALSSLSGYLVAHHILTADQQDRFTNAIVEHALLWAPGCLALAWGLWSRYKGRVKFLTALTVNSEEQVKEKIANGMGASVKTSALMLALLIVGASVSACGAKQYHTAVVANTSIAQSIFALQDAEIAAHNAKLVTDAKHAEYKKQILKLLQAGDGLTVALQHWKAGEPTPANVGQAISDVAELLSDLKVVSPQASAFIAQAQAVLRLLQGLGVLPSGGTATLAVDDLQRVERQPSDGRQTLIQIALLGRQELDALVDGIDRGHIDTQFDDETASAEHGALLLADVDGRLETGERVVASTIGENRSVFDRDFNRVVEAPGRARRAMSIGAAAVESFARDAEPNRESRSERALDVVHWVLILLPEVA